MKNGIDFGEYTHRPKTNARGSIVWTVFDEIIDENNVAEKNFFYCTNCKTVHYSISSTTTQLLRHSCVMKLLPRTSNDYIKLDQTDIENLKLAAAKFVSLDLRPFYSVECPGFEEMISAAMRIGQKYPNLTKDDLIKNMPGRKEVKQMITTEAHDSKEQMKCLLRKAINQGGLGCTYDLWTDNYRHNTYMAMTANFCIVEDTHIQPKRIVFYMGHLKDIVKSKEVIKAKIVDVFADFEINETEIKECVLFTSDR